MRAIYERTDTSYSFGFLHVCVYDGNGSITDYIDTNATSVAHYEYGPFGGIETASGSKRDHFIARS